MSMPQWMFFIVFIFFKTSVIQYRILCSYCTTWTRCGNRKLAIPQSYIVKGHFCCCSGSCCLNPYWTLWVTTVIFFFFFFSLKTKLLKMTFCTFVITFYFHLTLIYMFQEYNEFPSKRPSISRQEQAPTSYPSTQNHLEDNTDYSQQNEMLVFQSLVSWMFPLCHHLKTTVSSWILLQIETFKMLQRNV